MLNILLQVFGKLAGSGRAWMLHIEPIRSIVKALLSIAESAQITLKNIPRQSLPWLCDDDVIPYWEDHYGLPPNDGDTIEVRRSRVVSAFISIGGQAAGYLEYILTQSGFTVSITENLDGSDLGSEWDSAFYKIANGPLYWYTDGVVTYRDPVNKPASTSGWKRVAIMDVTESDPSRFELLRSIILRYKPAHMVLIVRGVGIAATYYDANLVVDDTAPGYDANLVSLTVDPVLALDGNLVFL